MIQIKKCPACNSTRINYLPEKKHYACARCHYIYKPTGNEKRTR